MNEFIRVQNTIIRKDNISYVVQDGNTIIIHMENKWEKFEFEYDSESTASDALFEINIKLN
jgi:hypothetical protein